MFTGIVEELGTVAALERDGGSARLRIRCNEVLDGTQPGDSISVSGCCLTVTSMPGDGFTADVMGETLDRTALGSLGVGAPVNLERAMRADGRLGGHLVSGHVDGVAEVVAVEPHDDWTVMTFSLPDGLATYVVEKGSITVDGASLTAMAVDGATFSVGLIPHTLSITTLGRRVTGDRVNLEVDMIAKYVERMLASGVASPYSSSPRKSAL